MQFYTRPSNEIARSPELKSYHRFNDTPNVFIQIPVYIFIATICLVSVFFLQKLIGIKVRTDYSYVDFIPKYIIFTFIIILVARFIISIILYPNGPFSKDAVYGFHIKSFGFYSYYSGPIKKALMFARAIAPFTIITIACLLITKFQIFPQRGAGYYIPLYLIYLNAAISCADIYLAIKVLLCPNGTRFIHKNKILYYKKPIYH